MQKCCEKTQPAKKEYDELIDGLTKTNQLMALDIIGEFVAKGEILIQEDIPKCIICGEEAGHTKLGKPLCGYHFDIANDHKRGR